MFYLLLLKDGQYTVKSKNKDLAEIKYQRKIYWKGFKYRIIESDEKAIQDQVDKLNKPVQQKESKLSKLSYRDIAELIIEDNSYKYSAIFNAKKEAIQNINNFTSLVTRNDQYKGLFKTSLSYCVIDDELLFISVFSYKGV